jgi:uncharacterized protein DUF3300/DUF2950 family protein
MAKPDLIESTHRRAFDAVKARARSGGVPTRGAVIVNFLKRGDAMVRRSALLACLLVMALTAPAPATAQPGAPPAAFTPEQLEQVAAPIALYPDPLLAQLLMASTYPLEVVQAARFVKDNPTLKGAQLNEKLKEQTWDDSVKSLVEFPEVLALMDQKLDWVQKLGDANTIQVCLAYVDAQREYYARDPDGDAVLQFAQTFASTSGRRDGLYWPTNPGKPPSPLGPFVARAWARAIPSARRTRLPTGATTSGSSLARGRTLRVGPTATLPTAR